MSMIDVSIQESSIELVDEGGCSIDVSIQESSIELVDEDGCSIELAAGAVVQVVTLVEQSILQPSRFTNTGSRVFALPAQPTLAIATSIEYCGVVYRLIENDYTISGTNLTLVNPVIAPKVGDTFLFIS